MSRKFAGGDATIREAAAAGGDVAREVLKKLNRRHLEHLSRAPQHAQDKPPPPLNDLEGAVARVSLDDGLNEDEETLRTLGDQPVLIWHHTSCDPPEVDLTLNDALTLAEDIPRWAARVTPAGCRPVGGQMHEIRRYDGDAEPVIARWAVGGEAPLVAGGPGGGGKQTKKGAKGNKGAGGREGGKGGAKPGGESQAKARPKRGRGKESGGKESGGPTRDAATVGGDENKNGAKAAVTKSAAARGAARPRARSPRVQSTREPNASTPDVTPPAPTVTNDNQASQASRASDASRGGGRASALPSGAPRTFPSVAGGVAARRPRLAAGLGVASRLRRGNAVGLRGAAAAAARGAAFAFL